MYIKSDMTTHKPFKHQYRKRDDWRCHALIMRAIAVAIAARIAARLLSEEGEAGASPIEARDGAG